MSGLVGLRSRLSFCLYAPRGKFFWTTHLCLRRLLGPRGGTGFMFVPGACPGPSAATLTMHMLQRGFFSSSCLPINRRWVLAHGIGCYILHLSLAATPPPPPPPPPSLPPPPPLSQFTCVPATLTASRWLPAHLVPVPASSLASTCRSCFSPSR